MYQCNVLTTLARGSIFAASSAASIMTCVVASAKVITGSILLHREDESVRDTAVATQTSP